MAYMNQLKKIVFSTLVLTSAAGGACAQSIGSLNPADYTVPTWTKLVAAYKQLQSAQTPYSINMVVNGDPRTRVGFNWFTNPTGEAGEVQVVEKDGAQEADFAAAGVLTFKADKRDASLNYYSSKNQEEINRTGIQVGETRSYTAHKSVAIGLKPGTTYSFRVGSSAAWSAIGSFTTAKDDKPTFSAVTVTTDTIAITTYTVDGNGKATEFDSFKVVKNATANSIDNAMSNAVSMDVDANRNIVVEGISPEKIELFDLNGVLRGQTTATTRLDASGLAKGAYLVKATAAGHIYTKKIVL